MIINNNPIDSSLIPQQVEIIRNPDNLLGEIFNIKGYGSITLYGLETIKSETESVHKLCIEDSKCGEYYWIGKRNGVVIPGNIDPSKMIVIGDFGYDIPICLDFRGKIVNPSVIWLSDNGWEKMSESHEEFIKVIKDFKGKEFK